MFIQAIGDLADEIARDNPDASPDACSAWAVQHLNEAIMHRNAFSGVKGMTEAHAQAGLADYLADRKIWSQREFEAELAARKVRCVAFRGHDTLPDGTIIHNSMEWLWKSWKNKGHTQAEYLPEDCPERDQHK